MVNYSLISLALTLSNIMLNEFDQYLHTHYLSGKARKDRWYWNHSIQRGRSTAVRENWQWKPAVAYCRYADDCVPRRQAQWCESLGSHAAQEMRVGPSVSACRRRHQLLLHLRDVVVSEMGKGRA